MSLWDYLFGPKYSQLDSDINPDDFDYENLTDSFILNNKDIINWRLASSKCSLFILNHPSVQNKINWNAAISNKNLSSEHLKKHIHEMDDWDLGIHLGDELINEFKDVLGNMFWISLSYYRSIETLEKFKDNVYWDRVARNNKNLTISFIEHNKTIFNEKDLKCAISRVSNK